MKKEFKYTNNLIKETSPYLFQHAHNPVNWYTWGEEALKRAINENKPVIISIGYSACHWCHVMEKDSFEDESVAQIMNDHFICIKVDREERPDIDSVYMDAVQILNGSGGWPLNCITLPDLRPIYGGTFFPKAQWIHILKQLISAIKERPEEVEKQASLIIQGLKSSSNLFNSAKRDSSGEEELKHCFYNIIRDYDPVYGGQSGAPKFPMPSIYQFLLQYHLITKDTSALKAVTHTLDQMAQGGLYDQLGGGFARYSTDEEWKVPHFEKMLYDNALLISLYSQAYQKTKSPLYETVVRETVNFTFRELLSPEGGFYSSLDADSEGTEGQFYVWSREEVTTILGDNSEEFIAYYNITELGNWEDRKNILFVKDSQKEPLNLSEMKNKLLKAREKRVKPSLDDKILTSWNGLMIKALCDAYRTFQNEEYLKAGVKAGQFISSQLKDSRGNLNRNYKNGKATINGFLDDYAFIIEAFISLYQITFNEKWLKEARELTDYALKHFFNNEKRLFYYTSDRDPELITRKIEFFDNVMPSGNSVMAQNLYVLGHYFKENDYISSSVEMVKQVKKAILQSGPHSANWALFLTWIHKGLLEITITGDLFKEKVKELNKTCLPHIISAGNQEGSLGLFTGKFRDNQTLIYVCKNKTCFPPVSEVSEALGHINEISHKEDSD